jgi:hypothetical protein
LLRLNVETRTSQEIDEIVGLISKIVQAQMSSDTEAAT